MISWGLIAALTSFVRTPREFYFCRFLLGAAEAGFFPGVVVYLSHWFRYKDRTRAKSWFMMSQPLSIVIGTPLSRWILETVHWGDLQSWRWVFILEGLPSAVCGVIALYYLDAFRHWQTALLILVLFLVITGNQGIHYFLLSVVENMKGLSVRARTVVAVLPYLCSMAGIVLNGYLSNRTSERRWHTAAPILNAAVALMLAVWSGDRLASTIPLLCLAGFTFQAYLPPFWTLPTAYLGGAAAATAVGTINSIGNLGRFVGPPIFGLLRDATGHYQAGLLFLAGCMFLSGLLATQIRVEEQLKK